MKHICVGNLTIIGSDNGLLPGRRQAIIWTNAGILIIRPLGTNFNEILIEILTFSFMKMRLKMLSVKWRPFCLGLNVLSKYICLWNQNGTEAHKGHHCKYFFRKVFFISARFFFIFARFFLFPQGFFLFPQVFSYFRKVILISAKIFSMVTTRVLVGPGHLA